jgi:hypothetical protein
VESFCRKKCETAYMEIWGGWVWLIQNVDFGNAKSISSLLFNQLREIRISSRETKNR